MEELAGCSKRPFSKAAASEEPRRYKPHFVWAVRPLHGSWRTEKPLQCFRHPRGSLRYVEGLNDARTLLADFFSILPSERGWGPDVRPRRLEYSPSRPIPFAPLRTKWQNPNGGEAPLVSVAPVLDGGPAPVQRRRVPRRQ